MSATPINIPKPGGDVSATPINIPKPGENVGVGGADLGSISEEKQLTDLKNASTPGGSEADINLSPGFDGNIAEDAIPADDGSELQQSGSGLDQVGNMAQKPDPMPEPDLSPGVDGNVAETPEPGGTPPTPDTTVGINPGPDGNVAGYDDPGQPPPPPDAEGGAHVAEAPEPGLEPGFYTPAESPDPGGNPPGPNIEDNEKI